MTKTKKKRRSANEETAEAERVDDLFTVVGAGDYTPAAPILYPSGNCFSVYHGAKEAGLIRGETDFNTGPRFAGGVILSGDRSGEMVIVECLPMTPQKLAALRLWWQPLETGVPDPLFVASSTTIDRHSGAVTARRRDYRHIPGGASLNGSGWFQFPIPEARGETRRRTCRGGMNGTWQEYIHFTSQSGTEHDDNCGYAVNYVAIVERMAARFWAVTVHTPGVESAVRMYTDADGVTGFYNLREATGGRRRALQHFVQQHTRRVAGGRHVQVKAHLRGQTEFDWFGLRCEVNTPDSVQELVK